MLLGLKNKLEGRISLCSFCAHVLFFPKVSHFSLPLSPHNEAQSPRPPGIYALKYSCFHKDLLAPSVPTPTLFGKWRPGPALVKCPPLHNLGTAWLSNLCCTHIALWRVPENGNQEGVEGGKGNWQGPHGQKYSWQSTWPSCSGWS